MGIVFMVVSKSTNFSLRFECILNGYRKVSLFSSFGFVASCGCSVD